MCLLLFLWLAPGRASNVPVSSDGVEDMNTRSLVWNMLGDDLSRVSM